MEALHSVNPDLVARAAARDAEATNALLGAVWRPAYRTALALCAGNDAMAQDVVQDACVACFSKLRTLRDPQKFAPWFLRILTRCATKELKAGARWRPMSFARAESPPGCDDDWSILRLCLAELPPSLREPLILNAIMGYSSGEVGAILQIPAGTVRFRVHKARTRMEAALQDQTAPMDCDRPSEVLARA